MVGVLVMTMVGVS